MSNLTVPLASFNYRTITTVVKF